MKPWLVPARRRKSWSQPPFWALDAARFPFTASYTADREEIGNDFEGYVQAGYKANGIVFACIDRRQQVFSQARFQWREFRNGRPGDLFGSPELALIERPWPNGTTGELLSHMETDASLAGNSYITTVDDDGRVGRAARGLSRRLVRMRPDWTTLIIDAPSGDLFGLDARVVAYSYLPRASGVLGANAPEPMVLLPSEVCHYSPKPDPMARWRGMSWLTPVINEIMADSAATRHKLRFFDNGATPNMAIRFDKDTSPEAFAAFVEKYNTTHRGVENAYKTLFLAGGADLKPMSVDFKQLDFKVTQGAGENRIAVAGGVPAPILGISEGYQGSTLNTGNFGAARRLFVDSTMRDLWAKVAPSLQVLLTPPRPGVALAVDDRDIPFLREDAGDLAEIRARDAQTLRQLIDGGWEPDAAVEYVRANDINRLTGRHSGMLSVQLQQPGMTTLGQSMNGSSNGRQAANAR